MLNDERPEVFMAMNIHIVVFWVVIPCSADGPLICWYFTMSLNGVTTQKTTTEMLCDYKHLFHFYKM